jgi:lipid-A-disaccharide synthase
MTRPILVSSGEPSGDRIVARVAAAARGHLEMFGMGGRASVEAGVEIVADSARLGVMGLSDVLWKGAAVARAQQTLRRQWARRDARVALLVGFTEFHRLLGRWLRARGARVVWCGAPQVWAWRASRLHAMRACADVMAVLFAFEEPLWRRWGYETRHVGHPMMDCTRMADPREPCSLAVLCGSRTSEVLRTGLMLLRAAGRWTHAHSDWSASTIVSGGLEEGVRRQISDVAQQNGVRVIEADAVEGAAPLLHDFDLCFSVSGTASLEAAVSGAAPVVAYRLDPMGALAARVLVRTPWIALPNVILQRGAFPELVQGKATADGVLLQGASLLSNLQQARQACRQVRAAMEVGDGKEFGARVAALL